MKRFSSGGCYADITPKERAIANGQRSFVSFLQPRSPGSTPLSRWRLREDPGTHRYDTHVDWSEDIDILTLVVIGQNCLPCEMTYLCSCICHFLCNLKRNYRRLNIPRVVSTIHGNLRFNFETPQGSLSRGGMKVIDLLYSAVRVLIYYTIYNHKCTCVITSSQSPK